MRPGCERGYAMAALLVGLSVMGIMLGMALPAWRSFVQREREAELIFRGEQYVQAINLFSRRNGGFPTSLDTLRDGRYIRRLYKDPITNGDFQPVYLGQVGPLTPPVVPGAPGRGAAPAGRGQPPQTGQPAGRAGQSGTPAPFQATPISPAGQPTTGMAGQPGAIGAGPIVGVVSRSSAESMRLYNGRGHYNEWMFVSTAATQQAGAPAGAPGLPGRAGAPGGRGRGDDPTGRGRGGRGEAPGLSPFDRPVPPGRGPGGFQPSPFGRPGGPGRPTGPVTPGRGL